MRLTAEMTLKRGDYNCFRNSFCGMEFFPEHKHCFFEFFLVISGVLLHRLNGVDYRLNPGSIQLLQPGDAHALRSADPGGQVEIYNVNVASHEFILYRHQKEIYCWTAFRSSPVFLITNGGR